MERVELTLNAIEAEGLTKRFRRVRGYKDLLLYRWSREVDTAVDDVSLHIREGELFGLLGENGAGKTTLIRMLSTTLLPTSGQASVLGHDVVRDSQAVRQLIGIVSGDERSFYWRLTGRQNLEYFAALYHLPRRGIGARINELLKMFDIDGHADRRFDSFSTGTKQRFAIARGMLADPRVLFLDEPTRALDPIAAAELRTYLRNHIVGDLGYTALLATHTLFEAEAICDRIAILRGGRVMEVGTIDELRRRMSLAPVLELTISGPYQGLEQILCALSGVAGVDIEANGARADVYVRLASFERPLTDILQAVVGAGAQILSSTTRQPNLDDIYRRAHA